MKSYTYAGDFTVLTKLRSALIDNALYYGTYLVLVAIFFVYILVKKPIPINASSIRLLIITTSNTWALFLVIIFLGYGLVQVPRSLFFTSFYKKNLSLAFCKLSSYNNELYSSKDKLVSLYR
ncbi:hypothetical protein Ciccas_013583, partial [Cichlidogyrus casuarinus]